MNVQVKVLKNSKDTDRDNFLTVDEAKEYGLIDNVMQPEDK